VRLKEVSDVEGHIDEEREEEGEEEGLTPRAVRP
jgi:hypothetical protein